DELRKRRAEARDVRGARGQPGAYRVSRRARGVPWRARRVRDVLDDVDAIDELHREERLVARRGQIVEVHEVRMPDVGERPELALERVERRRAEVRQALERHEVPALAIERLVDDAHPSPAEASNDLVAKRRIDGNERWNERRAPDAGRLPARLECRGQGAAGRRRLGGGVPAR